MAAAIFLDVSHRSCGCCECRLSVIACVRRATGFIAAARSMSARSPLPGVSLSVVSCRPTHQFAWPAWAPLKCPHDANTRNQSNQGSAYRRRGIFDTAGRATAAVRSQTNRESLFRVFSAISWILIIIIIKFFNKKLSNATSHNGEENGVQIIVNNNVYTKLLSRNVVRSDR